MKKFIAIAALTVCATAAQAVATAWSTQWMTTGAQGNYYGFDMSLSTIQGQVGGAAGTPATGHYSADVSKISLGLTTSNDWANYWTANSVTPYLVVVLQGQNTIQAISAAGTSSRTAFYGQTNKAVADFTFSDFTMDSEKSYTVYFVSSTEGLSVGGTYDKENLTVGRFIGYTYDGDHTVYNQDGDAYTENRITAVVRYELDNVQVLPEPTVLALLALGVAGVALKRKVA